MNETTTQVKPSKNPLKKGLAVLATALAAVATTLGAAQPAAACGPYGGAPQTVSEVARARSLERSDFLATGRLLLSAVDDQGRDRVMTVENDAQAKRLKAMLAKGQKPRVRVTSDADYLPWRITAIWS